MHHGIWFAGGYEQLHGCAAALCVVQLCGQCLELGVHQIGLVLLLSRAGQGEGTGLRALVLALPGKPLDLLEEPGFFHLEAGDLSGDRADVATQLPRLLLGILSGSGLPVLALAAGFLPELALLRACMCSWKGLYFAFVFVEEVLEACCAASGTSEAKAGPILICAHYVVQAEHRHATRHELGAFSGQRALRLQRIQPLLLQAVLEPPS